MATTLGILEIPTGTGPACRGEFSSTDFYLRRFGDKSLLEWVLRRLTDSLLLDGVLLLLAKSAAVTASRLAPPDVEVLATEEPDPMRRFAAAVRRLDAEFVVRLELASPFVDAALIDCLICHANRLPDLDYLGYRGETGGAAPSRLGILAQWYRADAVIRADLAAVDPVERARVADYFERHPESFQCRSIPIPSALDRHDIRLAVVGDEDWEHAQAIYEALGADGLDWQSIVQLLEQQPAIRQRMALLNERHHEVQWSDQGSTTLRQTMV